MVVWSVVCGVCDVRCAMSGCVVCGCGGVAVREAPSSQMDNSVVM